MDKSYADRIADLQAQIEAVRKEEAAAKAAQRDAVKPVHKVTVEPSTKNYDRLYDAAVVQYDVRGVVVNVDECIAAGWSERDLFQGSMTWLFNTATGKLIGSFSGGSVFIGSVGIKRDDEAKAQAVAEIDRVAEFIASNPNGGDITHLTKYARTQD